MLTDTKIAAIKPPAIGQDEYSDHKVTGLRLRVGAGGKKTWTLRRRVGAKVINKKIGNYPATSLAAARKAAEKMIEALEREGTTDSLERTFGDVAEAWIEKVARPNNDSWKLQGRRLEMHVLPHWRDRRIAAIKRGDVRDLVEGIEGGVLPNRVLTVIKTVFRYALSRDWIDASPVEGITKPKTEAERDRVLTMDEVKRLWIASDLSGYPFGHFLRILMLTGQRRTEVASMRWSDIDLEAATWTLGAAETKSDRAHLVPLSTPALAILAALPRLGDYVFTTDGETYFQGFAKAKTMLDQFIAGTGEPLAQWTLHDLRRTAATHMVRLGISETIVGRVLNHARQGVTAKVYALHSYAPEKRHALDVWAADIQRAQAPNVLHLRSEGGK
jgi:Site-specific recombinase XerD